MPSAPKITRVELYSPITNATSQTYIIPLGISARDEGKIYMRQIFTQIDGGTGTGTIKVYISNNRMAKVGFIHDDFLGSNKSINWEGEVPLKAGDNLYATIDGGTLTDTLQVTAVYEERDY